MKRLFTFGCSFTKYYWWTWADILGQRFDFYENAGRRAAGNLFIFNKLIENIEKFGINYDDTVMIMWSSVAREDRFINNNWASYGNIFNQKFYSKEFVKKYVDIRGCYERDIPLIHAAQMLLDKIACENYTMSMLDILNFDELSNRKMDDISHLLELYSSSLNRIKPSVYNVVFNYNWNSLPTPGFNYNVDPHPTPLQHLEYIERVLPYKIPTDVHELVRIENDRALEFLQKKYNTKS